VALQSATLPAPLLLRAPTTAEETTSTSRCTVRLAAGRLTVTSAAQEILHFSAEFVRATAVTPPDDTPSSDLKDGMTAGQPLRTVSWWTFMPAATALARSPNVTAALAPPTDLTDGYRLHPAVLDGSFQMGATVPSTSVPKMVRTLMN